MRWAGNVARTGAEKLIQQFGWRNLTWGRPTRRWEDNSRLDIRVIG